MVNYILANIYNLYHSNRGSSTTTVGSTCTGRISVTQPFASVWSSTHVKTYLLSLYQYNFNNKLKL